MNLKIEIHTRALEIAGRFKKVEADLIDILQQADEHRIYLDFECRNLFEYTVKVLKLSESTAYNFIVVSRKAKEVPQLKSAIESGALSVSKARKITPVLTPANQEQWLQLAVSLPQKKLEQQVAAACPKEAVPERVTFVSGNRLNLQLGISEASLQKLRRVQDLESQKSRKAASLEETLEAVLDLYLEHRDPVRKAEKMKNRLNLAVARQVDLRDQGECTFVDSRGTKCGERRWLDVHHIIPRAQGGGNRLENLTTLCSGHHRLRHAHG